MNIVKIALIPVILYLACTLVGVGLFPKCRKKGIGMGTVAGLVACWALFYIVSIPVIIFQTETMGLNLIMWIYGIGVSVLILAGLVMSVIRLAGKKPEENKSKWPEDVAGRVLSKSEIIYLSLFLGIVIFQLIKTIFYAYADGDDAYYVALAQSLTADNNSPYVYDPYTGLYSGIKYRYALAPFPLWSTFIAKLSGLNVATVSHICIPVFLIPITYVIYNAVGIKLFKDNRNKRYMFLCLLAVFVMFSFYSFNSAEVFLLTRTRQGKEALANIIIPFLFLEFMEPVMSDKWEIDAENYIMIILIAISGALTSVFGNVLVLIILFAAFIYSFFRKAGWKECIKIALTALPGLAVLALYILL